MVTYLRQRDRLDLRLIRLADDRLQPAARDVANRFLAWLIACLPARIPDTDGD
jgi:hypothetical protein